jgi:hypothetical protein
MGKLFQLGGIVSFLFLSGVSLLFADEASDQNDIQPPTALPDKSEEEPIWTDQPHEWINEALYRRVLWLDSMFYPDNPLPKKDPRSRFRLKVFSVMDLEEVDEPLLKASISASIRLPGLQDRFRLILDSDELGRFPGAPPEDQLDRPRLALRRAGSWLDVDVGAKLRVPPVAFVRLSSHYHWQGDRISWNANHRFFYETQERFGTQSSLAQHCWLDPRWMMGHASSLRWSESTSGVEWQDTLSILRVLSVLEQDRKGDFIGHNDISHGAGIRLGVNGFHNGSHEMNQYKVALVYRRPLFRRDYLYLEISPEVEWERETEWEATYTLRAGVDVLFWKDR